MQRSGFTIIELVFVIVILGILAVVAIPRLSATRDDARASSLAHSVMTAVQEIASYATAKGETVNSLAEMSNTFALMKDTGQVQLSDKKAVIRAGTVADCLTLDINTTETEEILLLSIGNAGGDTVCTSLQSLINPEDYPIRLRGITVVQ